MKRLSVHVGDLITELYAGKSRRRAIIDGVDKNLSGMSLRRDADPYIVQRSVVKERLSFTVCQTCSNTCDCVSRLPSECDGDAKRMAATVAIVAITVFIEETANQPNENKLSHRWRERALAAMEVLES